MNDNSNSLRSLVAAAATFGGFVLVSRQTEKQPFVAHAVIPMPAGAMTISGPDAEDITSILMAKEAMTPERLAPVFVSRQVGIKEAVAEIIDRRPPRILHAAMPPFGNPSPEWIPSDIPVANIPIFSPEDALLFAWRAAAVPELDFRGGMAETPEGTYAITSGLVENSLSLDDPAERTVFTIRGLRSEDDANEMAEIHHAAARAGLAQPFPPGYDFSNPRNAQLSADLRYQIKRSEMGRFNPHTGKCTDTYRLYPTGDDPLAGEHVFSTPFEAGLFVLGVSLAERHFERNAEKAIVGFSRLETAIEHARTTSGTAINVFSGRPSSPNDPVLNRDLMVRTRALSTTIPEPSKRMAYIRAAAQTLGKIGELKPGGSRRTAIALSATVSERLKSFIDSREKESTSRQAAHEER